MIRRNRLLTKKYLSISISEILLFLPAKFINQLLKRFKIIILWRAGDAIGDQVLMAGIARSLYISYGIKCIVICSYPKLLENSFWIWKCIGINEISWFNIRHLLVLFKGNSIIEYNYPYRRFGFKNHLDAYRNGLYKKLGEPPIWEAHIAHIPKIKFQNEFVGGLSVPKSKKYNKEFESLRVNCNSKVLGLINPIGKTTYTRVKSLGFETYQKIVEATSEEICWVQVGKLKDKKLNGLISDFRGRSLTFLLQIIASSDIVLGDEGLLNHLASSFPWVKSFVAYSVFSPKKYYSYSNTKVVGYFCSDNLNNVNWQEDIPEGYLLPSSEERAKSISEEILNLI